MTVAALYVDSRGPYPIMSNVDAWDETRDARKYSGPYPVIAHPPCGAWGSLSHLSHGAHADCGPIAVDQVRAWGGVLEQPARSKLWAHCGLPRPWSANSSGFAVEVEQVAWGHVARKKTWLYFVGVHWATVVNSIRVGGTPTHWCSGGGTKRGRVPAGIKACSPEQRRRTPIAFAHWLVSHAESARV